MSTLNLRLIRSMLITVCWTSKKKPRSLSDYTNLLGKGKNLMTIATQSANLNSFK